MQQAGLFEQQINPTQKIGHRTDIETTPDSEHVPDSELVPDFDPVPESPTEWTNIDDDSSVSFEDKKPLCLSQYLKKKLKIRVSLNEMVIFY